MDKNAENSIVNYLSGNLSAEETMAFEAELAASENLRALYTEYETIWKLTNQLNYDQDATQASWHSFQKQVLPTKRIGLDWLKVAASVAILAAITVSMWFFGSTDISFTTQDTIQQQIFVDQTEVSINKNSSITQTHGFGEDNRLVTLSGQAHFNVSKASEAFKVTTRAGDVVVYGTQFDVYTDDFITTVELHEGSVHFEKGTKDIVLVPGERLVIMGSTFTKSQFSKRSEWNESIVCNDVPLAYILGQLKLNYSVGYSIKHRFLKEHYTVSLPKNNIQACLQILNDVVGKNFALIDGQIVLN